jgi:hypothetical protein
MSIQGLGTNMLLPCRQQGSGTARAARWIPAPPIGTGVCEFHGAVCPDVLSSSLPSLRSVLLSPDFNEETELRKNWLLAQDSKQTYGGVLAKAQASGSEEFTISTT